MVGKLSCSQECWPYSFRAHSSHLLWRAWTPPNRAHCWAEEDNSVKLASAASAKAGLSPAVGHTTKSTQLTFSPVGLLEGGSWEWCSRPFFIGLMDYWDLAQAGIHSVLRQPWEWLLPASPHRMTLPFIASFLAHPHSFVSKDDFLCGRRNASGGLWCLFYWSTETRCRQEQSLARRTLGIWLEFWLHQLTPEQLG